MSFCLLGEYRKKLAEASSSKVSEAVFEKVRVADASKRLKEIKLLKRKLLRKIEKLSTEVYFVIYKFKGYLTNYEYCRHNYLL